MPASTSRRPWSPFDADPLAPMAHKPDAPPTGTIPTEATSTAANTAVAAPPSPTVSADPAPAAGSGPQVREPNSALRTPHSQNTAIPAAPQVSDSGGAEETPHSAPNSAQTEPDGEEPPAEELTFKAASRQWLTNTGERVKPVLAGLRPPAVWTQPPASLQALVRYADDAPWADKTGSIRAAGRVWCRVIAVPVSVVAYYTAWLAQRPSRFLVLLVLYVVIAHTSAGSWLPWIWETA